MDVRTHTSISSQWVGEPLSVSDGTASARLVTVEQMAADAYGLVHGGFTFGLADYAAMLAVNDPNVVLGAAQCRFLAPVRVGEVLTAEARVDTRQGKKHTVHCAVKTDKTVLEAEFTCFVLDEHILAQQDNE